MTSFMDQLNLTPQERRIVVIIAVVVFAVLNLLLVWPHFKDLKVVRSQLDDTRQTIQSWNKEIVKDNDPKDGYKKVLSQLERQQGGGIVNQQVQLQRTVSDQSIKTGVNVSEIRPVTSINAKTNQFYEEQSVKISFECQEAQLVNFLFNIGNDPAMIRVRELHLGAADANRYRLKGDATLSANYAKQPPKAPPKPASVPGKTSPITAPQKRIPGQNFPNPRPIPGANPARQNL